MKILGIIVTRRDILGGLWFMKQFMLPLFGVIVVFSGVMVGLYFLVEWSRGR